MNTSASLNRNVSRIRAWTLVILQIILLVAGTSPAMANPLGGSVVAGQATINSSGSTLTINQSSSRAVINWQDFSINSGELTQFNLPNSASAVLNRVTGGNASNLLGSLQSNGRVFLINPNGIVFGQNAKIDVAGLVASTLDVSNAQFMQGGDLTFSGNSTANIVNFGTIRALEGDIYMIANSVENHGVLQASHGTVGLAVGQEVKLIDSAHKLLVVVPSAASTSTTGIKNTGLIDAVRAELVANGGNVYALAINNEGTIRANGSATIAGEVYLTAPGANVAVSGTVIADTGDVNVSAENFTLTSSNNNPAVLGSLYGNTTVVATQDVTIEANGSYAQIGGKQGDISVQAGRNVSLKVTGGTVAQIGHGGKNAVLDINAKSNIVVDAGNHIALITYTDDATAQIGHGGSGSVGSINAPEAKINVQAGGDLELGVYDGTNGTAQIGHGGLSATLDINANSDMTVVAGNYLWMYAGWSDSVDDSTVQIGHGGRNFTGSIGGSSANIDIQVLNRWVDLNAYWGDRNTVQIGHGGYSAMLDISVNSNITLDVNSLYAYALGNDTTAQVGHGGRNFLGSINAPSAKIDVTASSYVDIWAGSSNSTAQIGHGGQDATFAINTNSDVNIVAGRNLWLYTGWSWGSFDFTADDSTAQIGHGGRDFVGSIGGTSANINVQVLGEFADIEAYLGDRSTTQIGHGGYNATLDIINVNSNVSVDVPNGTLYLYALDNNTTAQIGHGGVGSNGYVVASAIDISVFSDSENLLELAPGSTAQIANGGRNFSMVNLAPSDFIFYTNDDLQQPLVKLEIDTRLFSDRPSFSSLTEVPERSTNEIAGLSSSELLVLEREGQSVHTDSIAVKKRGQADRLDIGSRMRDLIPRELEIRGIWLPVRTFSRLPGSFESELEPMRSQFQAIEKMQVNNDFELLSMEPSYGE